MGLFLLAEASAPPVPHTPMSAADRLIGLFQVGRSLERYVEEFVELAYLTNWSDARLNALFLEGLDESTIRFDEPDDYDKGVKWPMMIRNDDFYVGTIPHRQHDLTPEARILEIPYVKNDLSMLIILPNKSDGLQELVESITYEKLLEWTEPDNMILFKNLDVEIPIFKLQEKYDLEDSLEALGIIDLFSDKCDLSGMAPGLLKLSKVVHKSFVEVDETGTGAGGGIAGVVQMN
ncbi:Serpin B4 [Anabarilius grahami]|uniref:Serpin B4 n=1 Tax=Anabarilius grahami TaxID=495550 RepID=A0A3N0Z1K2_ANAGA|nr:Serpin B4 [Anabarilius grahami]